ncbi:PREDICTED: uncharacterized protein LOC108760035 [Trachymyrmex cornetzi]|uniref:Ribosomal protein L7Ae/L30e/S12e/Gadd45 domain-containing protein n=1 Tax=Trachymyrmex cornetzi TaxID=471704 RepID=A0A151J8V0_9HYME|nr:PREDICTED: uncharacterized protein LOC108760035 [Trachymyrmex cornetzi]KYN21214.1 hypothetical protein ALC57_06407 [Trachymyrmex cornetzi]
MTTPVLTKKQQRHSLSAKTGPIRGLRNILAQPTKNFWPIINVDQYPELMTNLNTILPSIKKSNCKIPKDMLKNLTKKDRALARKKMLEETPPKPDILKFMVMGNNEVTRALEKNNVCSILLDANTDPLILIKHIISMAVNKKIPILMLPMLRTVTKEKGFPSRVLALKQEVMQCPNNVCYPIYKSIAEAFKDFELPECLLQCYKPDEVPDKSAMCKAERITEKDSDTKPNISKPKKSVAVFADVYKYRSSRDERVFVPPTINKISQVSQTLSDNFIPSDSDFDTVNDKNCTIISKNEKYVNIGKEEKYLLTSGNTEENQSFNELKLIKNKVDSTKQTNILSSQISKKSDDFIPLSSDLDFVIEKNCASTSKNERYVNIGKEKKRTLKSKNTDENNLKYKVDSTKQTKNILKRLRNEPDYLSLKIKCTQGSKKRKKATKFAKKKG